MSVSHVGAVSDAIRYINNIEIEKPKESIAQDIKGSLFNPLTVGFGGMEVYSTVKSKPVRLVSKNFGAQLKEACHNTRLAADKKTADAILARQNFDALEAQLQNGQSAKFLTKIGHGFAKIKYGIEDLASKGASIIKNTGVGKAIGKAATKVLEHVPACVKVFGSKTATALKGTGAAPFIIFDAAIGFFTEVIPAFKQGGAKSGIKQAGKTGLKAVAGGVGYAGGSIAGEAIGATIGSFLFPGVGTAIGATIGKFAGGFVGMAIAGGVAKKITGKSEVEKLQDAQIQKQAEALSQDPNSMNELKAALAQKIQEETANGSATGDTQKMAEYLNSGVFGENAPAFGSASSQSKIAELAQRAATGDTSIYNFDTSAFNSITPGTASNPFMETPSFNANGRISYFS